MKEVNLEQAPEKEGARSRRGGNCGGRRCHCIHPFSVAYFFWDLDPLSRK